MSPSRQTARRALLVAAPIAALITITVIVATRASSCAGDTDLVRVDRTVGLFGWTREIGQLKNGKKHGVWIELFEGKLSGLEHWNNGIQHGLEMTWHENGALESDTWFERGAWHGRYRIFYADGQIAELGWMRRSAPVGLWCHWKPDGRGLEKITEHSGSWAADRTVENPTGECLLTVGDGRRHFDPKNREYTWDRSRPTYIRTLP